MMMRNREVRAVMVLWFILTIMAILAMYWFPANCILLLIVFSVVCGLVFWSFTAWRYQKIASLASYLQTVQQNPQALNFDEYREGELSILKNEIDKVTNTLRYQAENWKQTKPTWLIRCRIFHIRSRHR